MNLPRVAVLHRPGGAATLHDIHRAASGVCEPVILVPDTVAAQQPAMVAAARSGFLTRVVGPDSVPGACAELRVAGLTTFHDLELDRVDDAAKLLGHPGAGTANRLWDKLNQRERLPARISLPAAPVDSPAEFRAAVARIGMPAVLKPRRDTGGSGVAFILDERDIRYQQRARRRWRGLMLESRFTAAGRHPSGVPYLASFVSVETVCTADLRRHVAIVDKLPVTVHRRTGDDGADTIRGTGDIVPCRLAEAHRRTVLDAVDRALEALGVRWRVTHTEVALTAQGPVIIEVNGRVGGHLNRLMHLAESTDLVRAALQCAIGMTPPISEQTPAIWAMGYYPTFPVLGDTVRSRVSRRAIRAFPGVTGVTEVAHHGAPQAATRYRMANLTITAPDAGTLDTRFQQVRAGLEDLFADDQQ